MAKIKRNAPCPCGSGKKYKKCCLRKDEEARRLAALSLEEAQGDLFEDFEDEQEMIQASPDQYFDEDDGDEDDAYLPDYDHEPDLDEAEEEDLPKLGAKDQALVDEWFDFYMKEKDPDTMQNRLYQIFDTRPDLVPHLYLHEEAIFSLRAMFLRQGQHQDAVDFLHRLLADFPEVYARNQPNNDNEIIRYLVMQDRRDEIPGYLERFRQNPTKDPDILFPLIDFLAAWNNQDLVIDFVSDIFETVVSSSEVMGGSELFNYLLPGYYRPILDGEISERQDQIDHLSECLAKASKLVALNHEGKTTAFHLKYIAQMSGKAELPDIQEKMSRSAFFQRNWDIGYHFMGFLHREKGCDWVAAELYRNLVYQCFVETIPDGKRPKGLFPFDRKILEKALIRTCKDFFGLNSTSFFGSLNAIYWYADFLEQHGLIDESRQEEIQTWCREFHEMMIASEMKQDFGALAWERFPIR